jgi:arabinose-5-phosphate isomerase
LDLNITKEIKSLLAENSTSIDDLIGAIGTSYGASVKLLFRCKGKIIVTGIGKSGLIAQKIASTFSSTGSPAIYLHPAEAMHGDLGIVQKKDIVLAIGKSGESEEILAILPSIKKIGAKVIALTSNQNSSLARASSLVLYVPVKKEACPLNLALTTSSLLTLAVGDAIAITLMKMRGFTEETFALYHPGGLLGKKLLLKAKDVMRGGRKNPVVKISSSMERLLKEISEKWTGAASVVDAKGKFLGLVTDYDIRRFIMTGNNIKAMKIKDIMNSRATYILDEDMAIRAVEIMEGRKKPFTVLPVLNKKKQSVGIIHIHDLIANGLVKDRVSETLN